MATDTLKGLNIVFPIYNEDETPFHNLVLRKSIVDSIVMSLGDKITGDVFYKDNTLQVTMKEYVEYNGIHYSLVNPPTVVREGMVADNGELKGMTKYSFEFYHPMCQLSNFPFTDVATKTGEEKYLSQNKSFSWIGKPQDYIDKLNKNLEGTQWYVRKSSKFPQDKDNELSEVLTFDNVTIADAIKTGYETWDIPYVVSEVSESDPLYAQDKRFVVEYGLPSNEIYASESDRQTDTPYVFRFGQGVGLKNNSRTPRNNKIVTRIAGYGSEDNVPYGYPQIRWYGNQDWDYTKNNDPNDPLSYPIYKGIVGGQYVKLIKHPFTRTHLMPSIYSQTVFNKVSPYLEDGTANPDYNPNTTIIDYYDAIATQEYQYTNEINPQSPSYESHEFADIKPELDADRNTGIVSAVPLNADLTPADHWDDTMDDDGNYLQSYFQITLPQLSFDLYACAAITQEMQINMRSGDCIGCTFPIQVDWDDYKANFYDSDGNFVPDGAQRNLTKYPKSNLGQINVVVQKDNNTFGTLMPNIYQQPKANDLFVFIGISLPLSYIANAEKKLDDAMKTYMLENNVYYFDYPLKFDEHFLATHTYILEQIRPNSIIHFDYGGVEQQLFVKQLTVKYGNAPLPQYDITLTDNVDVVLNQIGQVADDVDRLSTLISILRQSYSRNVWNELAKKLSKVDDDTAKGWITILKGVRTLSDFIELSKGGALYTDEDTLAHLTTDVARIRERILGTLRVGDTTSVETEPTLHVGGNTLVDNDLQVHEDLRVEHDAEIVGLLTALNRIYTNLLTSDNYTDDSAFGTGFSLSKKKGNENRSYLVVDELFVRWKAIFNELEIRRISYTGGNRVSSHAASKIVKVKDIVRKLSYSVAGTVLTLAGQVNVVGQTLNIDGGVTVNGTTATLTTNSVTYAKRCYAMKDDGTTATMNWWKVNDQARCQTFNIVESGNYQSASNKSYWRRVLEVGYEKIEIDGALSEEIYDYVDLSIADCMTGSDLPEEGDTIVQMGNRTDTSRQGFIVSEVAGTSAPDIQIFRNVNSYTLEGKRKIILSPDETHLRVNSLVIETEYDARRVPMERGDWDAIPEHKCYYYDLVQYNGSSWLCIFPESGTGGVKYTTEPPSETSIYWQIYAQKGADGKDGKDGKSFNILGSYDTEEELIAAHPTGQVGDAYIVAGDLYVWDEEQSEWHNSGQIKGDTGRGISSVTISYGKSNTSTTIPSIWYGSVDAVGLQAGDYLFTRMVYNYTDGESAQSEPVYSIGYIGRDGSSPIVGDIDNEVISVACDKDGKVLAEYNKTISVKIYNGSIPVTLKDNGLTVSSASGITIDQVSAANGTFRVHIPKNNTIAQANNFAVTATANIGGADVPRVMSFVVNGVRQGADGTPATIYDLIVSLSSIKKSKDGTPSVVTITATRQKTVGSTISDTTDGTLTYKIDGGSEQTYTGDIQTSSVSTGIEFIFRVNGTVVDRETVPVIMDGQDGKSVYIDSQSVTYSKQSQGNLDPTTLTYGSYPSSLSKGDWLYSKTTVVYKNSDGSTAGATNSYTVSYIGTDGDNGIGISGFTEHYKASANPTGEALPSSGDWGTNPSPSDWDINKPYLWNYEKIAKVDKNGNTTYERTTPSVVAIFTKGISRVVNHYVATSKSSGVTKQNPSDGAWSTSVQNPTATKRYLWNYETTEYSNGQSTETDPHIICVYGEKGEKGDSITKASADTYRYTIGDSGITPPSSGWSSTKPSTFDKNKWLWTETTIHWSDNSTTILYTAERNPNDGINGLPSAYLNLSDSVVDIEVDENGKATKDFYEEITYTMGASGKTLYINRVDVSTVSHVSIPAYILSPLADGLITVSGTTATLTKGGVTVSGTKATLPYGYTALPQIVVSAQDGETINEGVVEVSGVAIDKDGNEYMAKTVFSIARQYYAPALQIVLSQSTMILTQNESTKEIYLDDAYTDVSLRIGSTDITDGLTIKADVSTFYDETQERDVPSCNVRVDGNRVRITDIASYAYIPEGSTTETRVYCEKGWVDITVTYRGKPYVSRLGFYCNLLGSWKETIEGDVDRAIAESTTYEVDGQKFTIKDNLGEFVQSSTENTSRLSEQVDTKASHSEVKQTAEQISTTITNKLGETGININGNTRSIRLQADTTTIDSDVIVGSLKTKPDANGFFTEINGGENRVAKKNGNTIQDVMRWGVFSIDGSFSNVSSQIFYKDGNPSLVINCYGMFSITGELTTTESAYWSCIKYYHTETAQGIDSTGLMDALIWANTKGRTTGSEMSVKATAEYYIFHCAKRTTVGGTTVIHPELEGLVYSEIGTIGTDMDISGGTLTNAGYYIEWDSDEYVGRKQVLFDYKQVFRVRASKVGSDSKIAYSGWIYYGYDESTPNIWVLMTSRGEIPAFVSQTFGAFLDEYHD